mgnify:CR=1 FL=1
MLTRLGPVETAVKKDRRVADAHIVRQFPDTLVVRGTPRVPVIALANSQGQVDLIDIEAVRYQTVSTAPSGVPVVRSAEGAAVTDTALRVALDVVQALPVLRRVRGHAATFGQRVVLAPVILEALVVVDVGQLEVHARAHARAAPPL